MHLLTLVSNIIIVCLAVHGYEKEAVVLRAARDRVARLPCYRDKVFLDGPDSYVIWMKNDNEFRHRYPNPNPEIRFGTRDHVYTVPCETEPETCPDETSLVIKKVTDRDEGFYRCRIHYQASPTVDYVINLKLVDPIGLPKIYTGEGQELKRGFVGPLSLDSDLTLICEVETDDLRTKVYWHRNGVPVGRVFKSRSGRIMRVEIHLHQLSRGDLNAHYECLAQNADVSEPMVVGVYIKMYLPPMSVEIRMNENYDLEIGSPRVIDCVVVGCVPPPAITWQLGSSMVRPSVHKELHDGNYTVSSLTLTPSLRDHGKELVCTAHNLYMSTDLFQDKVTINVGYRPNCLLDREERIGAVAHETETVKCVVDSNPEPFQFSWTFADSRTVYTSIEKVDGNPNHYSTTLSWQSRDTDIGKLKCRATNAFGEQKKPCTFIISAGGPPELPKCNVRRILPNALKVKCLKGWDGGRPQMVHMEIVDEDGAFIKNVSDKTGNFFLPNIVDHVNVTAVLYASNARGRSKERVIYLRSVPTISEADSHHTQSDWMPYIQACSVVVAMTIFGTILSIGARILLARDDSDSEDHDEDSLDIVPLPDGCYHREPDFVRDVRRIGSTNITVNQLAPYQNPSSTFPLPPGTMLEAQGTLQPEPYSTDQHTYYV